MCCVQGEVCGICKVEAELIYPGSKDSAVLKCGHVFHNTCLRPHDAKHGTCPVCRNVTGDPLVLDVQGGDGCVVLTCMKCGECAGDGDQLVKCTVRSCDEAIHQDCNYKEITDKQFYDETSSAPQFWCAEHQAKHRRGDVLLKPATALVSGSQDRAERLQRRAEAREEGCVPAKFRGFELTHLVKDWKYVSRQVKEEYSDGKSRRYWQRTFRKARIFRLQKNREKDQLGRSFSVSKASKEQLITQWSIYRELRSKGLLKSFYTPKFKFGGYMFVLKALKKLGLEL